MLLYVDLNCFNRPFDDQTQARIADETAAVQVVLRRIVDAADELAWSAALTFENFQHPIADRRDEIAGWSERAVVDVVPDEGVHRRASELNSLGFRALDAVHLACAEAAHADCFLTCDDRLLRRAQRVDLAVRVQNPLDYLREVGHA